MNKEIFVSFEQAKKLKELGFNEPCFYHYIDFDDTDKEHPMPNDGMVKPIFGNTIMADSFCSPIIFSDSFLKTNEKYDSTYMSCPTLSQACKWIREKHNIHIQIESVVGKRWTYDVVDINPIQDISGEYISRIPERDGYPVIDTYEQSQSAGIDVALGFLDKNN